MHRLQHIALLLIAAIALAACSTTSRLADGDVLYTGVKKLKYHEDSTRLTSGIKDQVFTAINVKPNNPLYSPYYRTPFPIGLWVYNHWDENAKGLKGWLYRQLVSKPVLMRRVNPQRRVELIEEVLHDNGYFTSTASYQINTSKKNPKKASVSYDVYVGEPYRLGDIYLLNRNSDLTDLIDSVANASPYLHTGSRYCVDSLSLLRTDITNAVRNKGYYFFRPEYLQFLADSVDKKGVIHIRLAETSDIPEQARIKYITNDITAIVRNYEGTGTPDTVITRRCKLIRYNPVRIKDNAIPACLRIRKGRVFRINTLDRTQTALANLGIFSDIDITITPLDTLTPEGNGLLDVTVNTTVDQPWEVAVEGRGAYKSNGYLGPGIEVSATHKNVFKNGEKLTMAVHGNYEWLVNKKSNFLADTIWDDTKTISNNNFEFGADVSLQFPRLLAPKFLYPSRRYRHSTTFSAGIDFLNRPHFFTMLQASAAMTWAWQASRVSRHEITPFKLTFNTLLSSSELLNWMFDDKSGSPMRHTYDDVFIPQLTYSYYLDKNITPNDNIYFTTTIAESGNLINSIWGAAKGKYGAYDHSIKGNYISQFVKGSAQLVYTHTFAQDYQLVSRIYLGAGYAYGNSTELPYREKFYVGGSNSLRGFATRSIGPGRFSPAEWLNYWQDILDELEQETGQTFGDIINYDQTGSLKFETNLEFRFPILAALKGAVFFDAGNVWEYSDNGLMDGIAISAKHFLKDLALNTGLGLRLDLDMLVVRLDCGIALHCPYDTGYSGYFNIRKFSNIFRPQFAIGYPF